MHQAFISLGSNQGDQKANLKKALEALEADQSIKITKVSSLYKTEPVGYEDQPWFYNAVAQLETSYSPKELLELLLAIESNLGRIRVIRWGPRVIDLDLLIYEHEKIETEKLTIPHPRMLERDFVLIPLKEIAPNWILDGKRIINWAEDSVNDKKVIFTAEKLW